MPGSGVEDARRLAWERRVEPTLLGLAVLFLVVYAVPILGPDLPESLRRACAYLGWIIWAIFAVDYAVRVLLAILDAERNQPNANITTFGDALWWAMTTITTVGYRDRFPVTGAGRFVAAGLMVAGIALLGVVTATVAAWFVQRVTEVQQAEAATRAQVDRSPQTFRRCAPSFARTPLIEATPRLEPPALGARGLSGRAVILTRCPA